MRTKRYILTAIALLLVMVLCAGFAFAADEVKFTYDGKDYKNGATIDKAYYFSTADGKTTKGEIMTIAAVVPGASASSNTYWELEDATKENVVSIIAKECDETKLTLRVNAPGTATINFYAGTKKLATLNVNLFVLDANVTYTGSKEKDYTVQPGQSIDMAQYFAIKAADEKKGSSFTMSDVKWSIEGEDTAAIATIDAKTGKLTAKANAALGSKVKVTATLDKAEMTKTMDKQLPSQSETTAVFVVVNGISFNREAVDEVFHFSYEDKWGSDVGRTLYVEAKCDHKDAKGAEDAKGFKWSSSNTDVITVTENEKGFTYGSPSTTVRLRAPGKATITATALDVNGKELGSNTLNVTITEKKAKAIVFSDKYPYPSIPAVIGQTIYMTWLKDGGTTPIYEQVIIGYDENDNPIYELVQVGEEDTYQNFWSVQKLDNEKDVSYSSKDLVWSIDNTAIATITESGTLTPIKAGDANVTATLKFVDGTSITKTVKVTVTETEEVTRPVKALEFSTKSFILERGKQLYLRNYLVETPFDNNSKYEWKSSDEQIVSVSNFGTITAVKAGTATITVTAKDNKDVFAQVDVTVVDGKPAEGIAFTQSSYEIWKGRTYDIYYDEQWVKLVPEDASVKNVSLSSSNPEVVYVGHDSTSIKAINEGTATITATVRNYDDTFFTATADFTVKEYAITGLAFSQEEYKVTMGSTGTTFNMMKRLIVKPDDWQNYVDSDLEGQVIIWKSNKTRIATVDTTGKVTPHTPGEVTIYAVSAKDENIVAAANLKIEGRKASKIKLNKTELTFEEGQDMTQLCTMTVQPATAYIKEISYKFSKTGIATVDEYYGDFGKYNGKPVDISVRALGEAGETWLTVTAVNETAAGVEEKLTAKVKVVFKAAKQNLAFEKKGYTVPIFAKKNLNKVYLAVLDKDTGKEYKGALAWSSSDKDVATVNKNGTITLKAEGTTEITATTKDGNKTEVKTKLTVKKWGISKLTGSNKQMMTVGQKVNIKDWVTVKPVGKVYNDKLTLKSSAKDVVMVDSLGNLSALKAGEATITVTAKDDTTKTKTITVTVVEKKVKK